MSIIPTITRPTIAANRTAEILFWDTLFVAENEVIYGVGDFARLFWADHYGVSDVTIDGTVWAASTTNVSAAIVGFYINNITITGTVVAEARVANSDYGQANAYAISNNSIGQTVTNSGTVYAYTDSGLAHAIEHWGPDVRIVNSGLVASQTDADGDPRSSNATALLMMNGGTLHNQAGGQILAEGASARGIIMSGGLNFWDGTPNILNDGTIHAVALADGQRSVGIEVFTLPGQYMVIENNGTIEADVAIRTGSKTWPNSPSDQTVQNNAEGIIRGDIEGDLGVETIINGGLIEGNVFLAEGDDYFDTSLGTFIGRAELGWGNDTFLGGKSDERVDGGRMADHLDGGAGNDILVGGLGDDTLIGGTGNDGLYGEYGNDAFVLAGADVAYGGQGTDHFLLTDLAFALIDGGDDKDTIELPAISGTFDLAALADSSRVTGIEVVDIGSAGNVALEAAAMASALGGLQVVGSGDVTLYGSWTDLGTTMIDGSEYRTFSANGHELNVLSSLAVTLQTDAPTDLVGLDPVAGGVSAPLIENDPDFDFADPVSRNINYTVTENLVIESYELWLAHREYTAFSAYAREATITNYGSIVANGWRAVSVDYLELFANHGSIIARSTDDLPATAFTSNQATDLLNTGSIIATTENGTATAATIYDSSWEPTPGLDNSGLIRAVSTTGDAFAVRMPSADDNAINSGTIEAIAGRNATGLDATGQFEFLNSGSISAEAGTRAIAVKLTRTFDFTNSGTIVASATDPSNGGYSVGVSLWDMDVGTGYTSSFTNSGTIIADRAFSTYETDDPYNLPTYRGAFLITNDASGHIEGDILMAENDDTIINLGFIAGEVELGAGADLFDTRNGTFVGTVDAGDGWDRVLGSLANDIFSGGDGNDRLNGGDGDDLLDGGADDDLIMGGTGLDTATYASAAAGVSVDLALWGTAQDTLGAGMDTLYSIENLVGSDFADFLYGDAKANLLTGGDGGDHLFGAAGDDTLVGQAGWDTLDGGDGNDLLDGGWGRDTASYLSAASGVRVDLGLVGQAQDTLGAGTDTLVDIESIQGSNFADVLFGGSAQDYLYGEDGRDEIRGNGGSDTIDGGNGTDWLFGGAGWDTIHGGGWSDYLFGENGNDTLSGGYGNDRLNGGTGHDVLDGGVGADILSGGWGIDEMTGGSGADTFLFERAGHTGRYINSADTITDFSQADGDVIDLSAIDAIAGTAGDDAFRFIGKNQFSGTAGELRFFHSGGDTFLAADIDGDGSADMLIHLVGDLTMTAADFVL